MPTRRVFLQSAATAACLVGAAPLLPLTERQTLATASLAQTLTYDPTGSYPVEVSDVEYRRENGEALLARVYQPQGAGTFPAMVWIHGGAWTVGNRLGGGALMNEQLAASGIVIFAPDFRNGSPATPHPAAVQDINFATRWFKAHAKEFNASAQLMGGMGSSSGGHLVTLSAMRPDETQYKTIPLPEAPDVDASLAYLLLVSPILDPYGRFMFAQETGQDRIVAATRVYFNPWDTIWVANPTAMLERGEDVQRPPALIIQGTADENVTPALQQRFAGAYRAAGAEVRLEIFQGQPHTFPHLPGPETDRALSLMKDFTAHQLADQGALG